MEARLWTEEEIIALIQRVTQADESVKKGGNMKRPTVEQIEEYMNQLNILDANKNAEKFFNYYSANGWKVGKSPMKSWQSAIKTWNFPKKESKINGYNFIYVSEIRKDECDDKKLEFMYKYLRASVDKLYYTQAENEMFADWYLALEDILAKGYNLELIGKVANYGFSDLFWKKQIYNLPKLAKHFDKIKEAMIKQQ